MIEQITGMTYRDYVRHHIFARAGMAHSDFFRLDRVVKNVAEGSDPIRDEAGNVVGWEKNIYAFPPVGSPDSGALAFTFECPHGVRGKDACQVSLDQILDIQLLLYQAMMQYALEQKRGQRSP